MTEITEKHQILLKAVRALQKSEEHSEIGAKLSEFSDDEIFSLFFKNASKKQRDGITSLSTFGLKVLKACFSHWEIELEKPLTTKQHILLMRECKLPYYLDKERFVTFEASIGVMLKLAQGNNEYIEQMFEF